MTTNIASRYIALALTAIFWAQVLALETCLSLVLAPLAMIVRAIMTFVQSLNPMWVYAKRNALTLLAPMGNIAMTLLSLKHANQ